MCSCALIILFTSFLAACFVFKFSFWPSKSLWMKWQELFSTHSWVTAGVEALKDCKVFLTSFLQDQCQPPAERFVSSPLGISQLKRLTLKAKVIQWILINKIKLKKKNISAPGFTVLLIRCLFIICEHGTFSLIWETLYLYCMKYICQPQNHTVKTLAWKK